ncbi:MAG: hypothetical protein ACREM9_08320 [Gemmatimonadales bacterium]
MRPRRFSLLLPLLFACSSGSDDHFAEVQRRGGTAMGVDQYTSTHVFAPLPDGGRVELQRDAADSAGRARILAHMGEIADAFAKGDFTVPGFVHAQDVPGTAAMARRRAEITYVVESLPRGGALRITTGDSSAVRAIHEFLAFQRRDHRAHGGGSEH